MVLFVKQNLIGACAILRRAQKKTGLAGFLSFYLCSWILLKCFRFLTGCLWSLKKLSLCSNIFSKIFYCR